MMPGVFCLRPLAVGAGLREHPTEGVEMLKRRTTEEQK
jgi:hypothetical protein